MSESLKKTLNFLQALTRVKDRDSREVVLKHLGDDKILYDALSEIARNYLKGNINLSTSQSKKIKRHSKVLKELCCKKNRKCAKKRKELLVQSGGFLPILIPAVASIISAIISRTV